MREDLSVIIKGFESKKREINEHLIQFKYSKLRKNLFFEKSKEVEEKVIERHNCIRLLEALGFKSTRDSSQTFAVGASRSSIGWFQSL